MTIIFSLKYIQGNVQDGSELAKQMPQLTKLKRALYSPEYRSFVEKITGLEADTLTDEVRRKICMTLDMTNDCQNIICCLRIFHYM